MIIHVVFFMPGIVLLEWRDTRGMLRWKVLNRTKELS